MEIDANTSTRQRNFLRKDKRSFSKKYILENCSLMFLQDLLFSSNNSIFLIGIKHIDFKENKCEFDLSWVIFLSG